MLLQKQKHRRVYTVTRGECQILSVNKKKFVRKTITFISKATEMEF